VTPHAVALVVVLVLFRNQVSVFGLFRRPPPPGPSGPVPAGG